MTKFDWSKYPPIPGFDSLKWKAERQAQILKETEGMTCTEYLEYVRKGAEEFDRKIERIRAERAKLAEADN